MTEGEAGGQKTAEITLRLLTKSNVEKCPKRHAPAREIFSLGVAPSASRPPCAVASRAFADPVPQAGAECSESCE